MDDAQGPVDRNGTDVVTLPATIQTTAFGTVNGEVAVPVADLELDRDRAAALDGRAAGERRAEAAEEVRQGGVVDRHGGCG